MLKIQTKKIPVPLEIHYIFFHYYRLQLVFCDDKTGQIDTDKYIPTTVPCDSTMKQTAQEVIWVCIGLYAYLYCN